MDSFSSFSDFGTALRRRFHVLLDPCLVHCIVAHQALSATGVQQTLFLCQPFASVDDLHSGARHNRAAEPAPRNPLEQLRVVADYISDATLVLLMPVVLLSLLALVIMPLLARGNGANELLQRLAVTVVRVLTYAGMATIFFGIVLITRTRGFANLFSGEWGAIVIACFVIAIALLGIGDGSLRPALCTLAATGDGRAARRFAIAGFVFTVLAIGLMTRALYARS